jgi:hypothetical protein
LTVNWHHHILFYMSDSQLYFAVGLPIIAVLASLTVSLVQISGVRSDIQSLRDDMREIRRDMNTLTGKVIELMERAR